MPVSYAKLSVPVRKSVNKLKGSDEVFKCHKDWCNWYRRCIGKHEEQVGDGTMTHWGIPTHGHGCGGRECHGVVQSVALLYSENVVDREFFRNF